MDDTPTNENPPKDFNKIDLTQLQGFSFGTQWTQDKTDPSGRSGGRDPRRDDRPRREGGGGAPGPGGPAGEFRRDRRGFRKPAGGPETGGGGGQAPEGGAQREGGGGEFRGGPRREGGGRGDFRGPRREGGDFRGPRFGGHGGPQEQRGPYISPFFNITFYPEDTSFTALAKTIRASCRTFELFDIAKTVIGKPDRFVVVVQRKPAEAAAPAAPSAEGAAPATPPVKPAPFSISVPDGLPFESDDAAIAHVLGKHLGLFFDTAEVEVEPPKGSFQVINKCGVTGELLGPPNYHRYNQIVQQHHAQRLSRMPFEVFRARIETVRDPEIVNQWLEKMKKVTRFTWKHAAAGETPLNFDTIEDARLYLLTHAREKVVKNVESARFHGKALEILPQGEIKRSVEGALERQRRFPLDTANALRGRLRREGFTIFKKGSKGISYVCAVKRKFRVPGQTFADSIGALITYIEANPMVRASELPDRFLGIKAPVAPAKPVAAETPAAPAGEAAAPAAAAPALSIEDQQKLSRLQGDLRWLITEGYVTEFIDGRLFAPPPMVEARKKEIEGAEHDPENFPEAPPEPAASAAPVAAPETAAPEAEAAAAPAVEEPKPETPAT